MNAPVKMVCSECLKSVELFPDETGRMPTSCPNCGGTVDDPSASRMTVGSDNVTLPLAYSRDESPAGQGHWNENWSRGGFGTIGRFHLRDVIGDGGFGQVYKAFDPRLDRDVALKVLRELNPSERVMERFFREARAAASLKHPNIVGVHDSGYDGGRCWISFEYVKGVTLARRVEQQDLSMKASVRIVRDLSLALDYAHKAGVFHRDVKPANVIIDKDDGPHLIDFGLARRENLEAGPTREGSILGTPFYLSPEAAEGKSHLADARSDVYSLGVILFEILAGRRPSAAPSQAAAAPWHVKQGVPAPPIRTINPAVPVELEKICTRALATEPTERYSDAGAFAEALDRWLDPGRGTRAKVFRALTTGLGVVVAAAAVAVAVMPKAAPIPQQPEVVAPRDNDSATTTRESWKVPAVTPEPSELTTPSDGGLSPVAAVLNDKGPFPVESLSTLTEGAVVVFPDSKRHVYHARNCRQSVMSKNAKVEHMSFFKTAQDAEDSLYRAAGDCHPYSRPETDKSAKAPGKP